MRVELLKYLKIHFSQEPFYLDRLIVSGFLSKNNIVVNANLFLRNYVINCDNREECSVLGEFLDIFDNYGIEFNFETLIELFEFVISPSDRVVNGAVYTPNNIREYIVSNALEMYTGDVSDVKAADISCGCGGFLLTLAQKIHQITHRSLFSIFRDNLYGVDIAEYSIQRTKILLTLFAVVNGEDEESFDFNLFTGNTLTFDWEINCPEIRQRDGFNLIVGNPPYVCSRNMDRETLDLMQNWEVASSGHPDLYIPFFQIGLQQLNETGILGYITVNTFIKSINGRSLRAYFEREDINITLLNFGGEQLFQDRNTYTCICFLKHGHGMINYQRIASEALTTIDLSSMRIFNYAELNHNDGWTLVNDQETVDFINIVEQTGLPFKDLYNTKNGIATLKNEVYKFRPYDSDDRLFYLNDGGQIFPIERTICKRIVNANKLKTVDDIERIMEQIIFPYDENTIIISEDVMQKKFPLAYAYLLTKRELLAERDKGTREYEVWYAFGRRQSMDIHAFKLFFPHICERPTFVICEEMDLLFYNGIALVSNNLTELKVIKKVMESDLFFKYISNSTKDYSSGYISMSKNYLKNFGVYQFTQEQQEQLLMENDPSYFLEELYGVADLI